MSQKKSTKVVKKAERFVKEEIITDIAFDKRIAAALLKEFQDFETPPKILFERVVNEYNLTYNLNFVVIRDWMKLDIDFKSKWKILKEAQTDYIESYLFGFSVKMVQDDLLNARDKVQLYRLHCDNIKWLCRAYSPAKYEEDVLTLKSINATPVEVGIIDVPAPMGADEWLRFVSKNDKK